MPPRSSLAGRSLAAATLVLLVVAACGTPAAPALTDPTEIVTAALQSTEAAKSVHVDVAVDGAAPISLPGIGGTGAPFQLTGTSASVDVDLANAALHATFNIPTAFNLSGELIAVDGKAYAKTSLTGAGYQVIDLGSSLGIDPTDTSGLIDTLGDVLLSENVTLVKSDDIACGGKQCYTVAASLSAEQLAAMTGGIATSLPIDLDGASLDATVRVEQDAPNHLAGVTLKLGLPGGEALTIDVTFSKWDEPVSISAPPADQVKAA